MSQMTEPTAESSPIVFPTSVWENQALCDYFHRYVSNITAMAGIQLYAACVPQGLPQGTRTVLQVGCGTGIETYKLYQFVAPSDTVIIASDYSQVMMNSTKAYLASQGIPVEGNPKLSVVKSDVTALDQTFEPASADVVLCNNVLHLLSNPGSAVEQIFKVLKPGGRLGFTILGPLDKCTFFQEQIQIAIQMENELETPDADLAAMKNAHPHPNAYLTDWIGMLRAAGFERPRKGDFYTISEYALFEDLVGVCTTPRLAHLIATKDFGPRLAEIIQQNSERIWASEQMLTVNTILFTASKPQ